MRADEIVGEAIVNADYCEERRRDRNLSRIEHFTIPCRFEELKPEVQALILEGEKALAAPSSPEVKDAPCPTCGYNGPGYYQPDTHACVKAPPVAGLDRDALLKALRSKDKAPLDYHTPIGVGRYWADEIEQGHFDLPTKPSDGTSEPPEPPKVPLTPKMGVKDYKNDPEAFANRYFKTPPKEICQECDGTGRTGAHFKENYQETVNCWKCNGTGKPPKPSHGDGL